MQKVLHINADKCTGCLQCEMACSFENYGTFATAKSRIKVFDFHHTGKKVPYTCTQCDEAWCLHACPVEAITIDSPSLPAAIAIAETLPGFSYNGWNGVSAPKGTSPGIIKKLHTVMLQAVNAPASIHCA